MSRYITCVGRFYLGYIFNLKSLYRQLCSHLRDDIEYRKHRGLNRSWINSNREAHRIVDARWVDGRLVEGSWVEGRWVDGRWVDGWLVEGS